MLHGNAAAERFDAVDVGTGDGLCMVEEPVQAVKRNIAVNFFEHVQHAADGLVVGGVQAERPAVLYQMAHHALQLILHTRREVRTRFEENLQNRRRKTSISPAPLWRKKSALARREHVGPFLKVFQLVADAG